MRTPRAALGLLFTTGCLAGVEPLSYDAVTFDGQPVALQAFCPHIARAYCEGIDHCQCESVDLDACRTQLEYDCDGPDGFLGPRIRAAIEAGDVVYDPARAGFQLERVAMGSPRCEFFELAEWTAGDLLDFGGVLAGTRPVGEACTLDWETTSSNDCRDAICDSTDGRGAICRRVVAPGEACGAGDLCADLTQPLTAPSDASELAEHVVACGADGVCPGSAFSAPNSVCLRPDD